MNNPSNLFLTNKTPSVIFTEKSAIILLIAMHIAGILGLLLPFSQELFKMLVPFNLLANAAIIIYYQKERNIYYWLVMLLVMLVGFWIEVVGVHTGIVFGIYWYKTTLGYKFLEVPLLIAVNWLIVIFTTSALVAPLRMSKWLKVLLATFLTVGLDVLIEPTAIKLDFWDWQNGIVPLQNYLGWFFTALILHIALVLAPFEKRNPVSAILYVCEFVFFVILRLTL
jgi:putative membrane protein